jgi:hypothetical protein
MKNKTFKCVICEKEVTKPQSYSYKDGRACRVHPEVLKAHEQAAQMQKANLDSHIRKERPLSPGIRSMYAQPIEDLSGYRNPHTYCWHCSKDGIFEREVYLRLLVNMSKTKLNGLGPINPFDPNSPPFKLTREDMGDKLILKQFPLAQELPEWKIKQLVSYNLLQVAQLLRVIVLCDSCAVKYGFDWQYDRIHLENLKLTDLFHLGVAVEQVADDIAMKEILNKIFHSEPNTLSPSA